jgi:hypothetical protein
MVTEEVVKEDATGTLASGEETGERRPAATSPDRWVVGVNAGGVEVRTSTRRHDDVSGDRKDAVKATVGSVNWTNPGGRQVKAFGAEAFAPGYTAATYKLKSVGRGAAAAHVANLAFTLDVKCEWGTKPKADYIDVVTGNEPKITADSAPTIADDLTPALTEKSWLPPRKMSWAPQLSARHEKFHSTDDKKWVEGPGKAHLIAYLNKQTVELGPDERAGDGLKIKMEEVLDDGMKELRRANLQDFYKGGRASYYSYKGEERAYADGKQPYLELAAKVRKRGKTLKAAADKAAKDEKK